MIQLALVQLPTFELPGNGQRADDSSLSQLALGGEAGEEGVLARKKGVGVGSRKHPAGRGCS